MTKYKIVKEEYFNEYGVSTCIGFKIKKYLFCILNYKFWKFVTVDYDNYFGSGKTVITFKTQEAAEDYINTVLCPNKPIQKWVTTDIYTHTCNN